MERVWLVVDQQDWDSHRVVHVCSTEERSLAWGYEHFGTAWGSFCAFWDVVPWEVDFGTAPVPAREEGE
jgi:hypothetical protein